MAHFFVNVASSRRKKEPFLFLLGGAERQSSVRASSCHQTRPRAPRRPDVQQASLAVTPSRRVDARNASSPATLMHAQRAQWHCPNRRILFASVWLIVLTVANAVLGGALRSSLLYIIPVAAVAYDSLSLAIICAGLACLSAWLGGAIPSSNSVAPVWIEGLWAFAKLSVAAVAMRWALHARTSRSQ